jgi:hypothetical protein
MNKMIQMGDTVSVSFEGRTGTKSVYKVSGYKKNKPEDWLDEDFYVEAEDGETVTAVFVGSADETDFNDETVQGIPNRPALEDGVNEITIKSGGKEYYAAIYLVRCSERVGHDNSGRSFGTRTRKRSSSRKWAGCLVCGRRYSEANLTKTILCPSALRQMKWKKSTTAAVDTATLKKP